jgi:adenine-specific DNA-methyltransferase
VVEQFNRKKGWHCRDVEEIADLLEPLNRETRTEANDIVNSIRICDPAVGSGHFVVSALKW